MFKPVLVLGLLASLLAAGCGPVPDHDSGVGRGPYVSGGLGGH